VRRCNSEKKTDKKPLLCFKQKKKMKEESVAVSDEKEQVIDRR